MSSGFVAGGVLARNSGPKAALGGGLAFAAFSAAIDLLFMRRETPECVSFLYSMLTMLTSLPGRTRTNCLDTVRLIYSGTSHLYLLYFIIHLHDTYAPLLQTLGPRELSS